MHSWTWSIAQEATESSACLQLGQNLMLRFAMHVTLAVLCRWAIKLATDAVVTVLRVDQIIMAKQAGGPKPPPGGVADED